MNETTYKAMKSSGALNIVLGIIAIVFGVTIGILSIINGSRLLKRKSNLMF